MLKYPYRIAYEHIILCVLIFFNSYTTLYAVLSSLAKNDAFPMFSANDPHEYLLTKTMLDREAASWADERGCTFSFSVSAFFQNADRGKPINGGDNNIICMLTETTDETCTVEGTDLVLNRTRNLGTAYVDLLDLTGRTPMIPLTFGNLPQGQQLGPILQAAQTGLFPTQTPPIEDESVIDPFEQFGFFSFPARYRKKGVRFDLQMAICGDFGLHAQTGVAAICQAPNRPINRTCEDIDDCFESTLTITKQQVNDLLMEQLEDIAEEIDLNIAGFQKTSIEEIRLQVYWRHAYDVNPNRPGWPQFYAIPYLEAGASFSPGAARNTNDFFGLPFGNNKHTAAGFSAGLNLDFLDTIIVGGEVGYTHFFGRDFDCFRIPNSILQNNIFPFRTSVHVDPGHNFFFTGTIAARHFLEHLSMWFQYVTLEHQQDRICLKQPDPAFHPEELAEKTGFKMKVANIGFTYDFSPNLTFSFLWQAPLSQRNTYRSTTIMFGVTGYF